jgi:hypothetical protein
LSSDYTCLAIQFAAKKVFANFIFSQNTSANYKIIFTKNISFKSTIEKGTKLFVKLC